MVFVLSAVTDFFDGYVARKYNQITPFGTFLDPISDKIFVATLLVLLVAFGRVTGFWILLVLLIFAREFLVSARVCRWQGDQGDRAGFACVAEGDPQGDPGAGRRIRLSAQGSAAAADRAVPGSARYVAGRERGARQA